MPKQDAKLQRWVDLLAALLDRQQAATFEELAPHVPEYALAMRAVDKLPDAAERETRLESLKRKFERDKQELRAFGVPIASVADENGNDEGAYRLQSKDFYLPYLAFITSEGERVSPKRVDRNGYKALATLTLDHDELSAVVNACAVTRDLGNPLLASDANSALRKLAVDLPVDAVESRGEPSLLLPRARPGSKTFETLTDALYRRKRVSFDYHALGTDKTERRNVEPYGLFFLNGHWYVVGRDVAREGLRNFRLSRVQSAKVNPGTALSPDFEIPASFQLQEHAASRHAWELGDSDSVRAIVAVRGKSGPARAAAELGREIEGKPDVRAFTVRRTDTFVRWLLSTAGALVPLEPESLVQEYRETAQRIAALYDAERPVPTVDVDPTTVTQSHGAGLNKDATESWSPRTAAAQFKRVLQLVPRIADGRQHDIDEVAAAIGTDVKTVQADLYSLAERYDLPGAFVEGVAVMIESGRVSALTSHLRRPMRFTVSELWAVVLGLSVLRSRRTPDEHDAIDCAQEKLRAVVAKLPADPLPLAPLSAETGDAVEATLLRTISGSIARRRKLRLGYIKSGSDTVEERVVKPYSLVMSNGMLYLVAGSGALQEVRMFRFDRIESAEEYDEGFELPADYSVERVLANGRVFQRADADRMRVIYSPNIARWIAEREGRALRADGSLVMDHPLADREWGLRHVLQYGADAEVIEPASMREMMRERLHSLC